MNMLYLGPFRLMAPEGVVPVSRPTNTRTRKTVLKERRRIANAPKSIQKRVLKRK